MFLPHPRVKVSIVGSLRDREVACSASDRQGSNFESCVWRTVSSQSSHHPQEVLLAQFSLYVHKGGLKPDSFHLYFFAIALVRLYHHDKFIVIPFLVLLVITMQKGNQLKIGCFDANHSHYVTVQKYYIGLISINAWHLKKIENSIWT